MKQLQELCRPFLAVSVWPKRAIVSVCVGILAGATWGQETPPTNSPAAPASTGEAIYRRSCVECHGAEGRGVSGKFEHPFTGNRSVQDLATYIEQAMPEDDPEACVGDEAVAVAGYIRERFLAADALEARPRIELVHLTAPQYENAIADLFRELLDQRPGTADRGLHVEYFDAKDPKKEKRLESGVTSDLDVDWLQTAPFLGLKGEEGFFVRWEGAIFAEESGSYQFHIHSPNGFRLFVNHLREPVIDNWVSTPTEPDKSGTVKLLGGRWYNFKVECFRFKDPAFNLRLTWQRPRRTTGPIAAQYLAPDSVPPVFVVETIFPPDDSSVGYPRGTLVSKEWDAATTEGAIEIANRVATALPFLVKAGQDASADKLAAKSQEFCRQFAALAFRRELSADEIERYVDQFFSAGASAHESTKKSLIAILKSPWFLYVGLPGSQSPTEAAAERLAWILWDSIPDRALRQAAAGGDWTDPAAVQAAAERMLNEPAARRKMREFFVHWLRLDDATDLSKDPNVFAQFDGTLADDLQESLLQFLDDCVWGESDDFRRLLLADQLWLNSRLREFYGVEPISADAAAPQFDTFQPVAVDPQSRAGLLTHPLLLSQLAYYRTTSPIHRGVFVSRQLLGVKLNPPPVAVEPLGEDYDPAMTTRQRVEFQTKPDNCMTCHRVINPFGFALESLDAVGRIRATERDRPVDTRVIVETDSGNSISVEGPRQLAEYLAASPAAHRHFVQTLFHHLVKQPIAAYGEETWSRLTDRFVESGYRIRPLIVDIAVTAALFEPEATPTSTDPAEVTQRLSD